MAFQIGGILVMILLYFLSLKWLKTTEFQLDKQFTSIVLVCTLAIYPAYL